jgi:hypothetical protein
MAEDSPAPPLPRRVPAGDRQMPGGGQGPDAGPVRPAVLSEDVLQRIRDALGSIKDEAPPERPPAQAERPASLPRRVPGAGKGPRPPAVIARPRLPFTPRPLPSSQAGEAAADEFPALSFTEAGGVTEEIAGRRPDAGTEEISGRPDAGTEEISGRPDAGTEEFPGRPDAGTEEIAGRPGAGTEEISGRPDAGTEEVADRPAPAPRPGEGDPPDRHDHADGETGRPGQAPGQQKNGRGRRVKRPARRAKVLGRRAKVPGTAPRPAPARPSRPRKPAPRKASAFPGEPTVQMAPLFPDEPAPEEATPRPPALSWPQRALWGRRVRWLFLLLLLVSTGLLALLLAR